MSGDNNFNRYNDFPYKSYEEIQNDKKRKSKVRKGAIFFALLVVALIGGALSVGVWLSGTPFGMFEGKIQLGLFDSGIGKQDTPTAGTTANSGGGKFTMTQDSAPADGETLVIANDVTGVVEKAASSVVGINTESYSDFMSISSGSGIILSEDGYIVTNAHVISGGDSISVTLDNGTVYAAYLIGSDEFTDIAVIKIDAENLPAADFGNSDDIRVGETAVAIGNPTGQLMGSVTAGIISAVSRNLMINNNMMTLLQTDASINSGNSGGPLINKHGQVIGINSAKISATGYEGIGFAIPINTVKPIVEELIRNGYVSGRPIVGLSVSEISKMASSFYSIPQGLYINSVMPSSDAKAQGLAQGDVITHIGDERIYDLSSAVVARNALKAGDEIDITVYRRGKTYSLTLKLGEQNLDNGGYNF
ncbi:MAG: trypsin-like peptidase domain-containing protein [Clostridia bacterium]|nr:trypsin-like peptidase domain-containing protein [Clostridia bacterium]MBR5903874.1 trypsin-like peptidase domain-containing protein [Clostridia bacterium]